MRKGGNRNTQILKHIHTNISVHTCTFECVCRTKLQKDTRDTTVRWAISGGVKQLELSVQGKG